MKIFRETKSNKIKLIHFENQFIRENGDPIEFLKILVIKLVNREKSLSKSSAILLEQVQFKCNTKL